jgi:hypothetical protein
MTTLTAPDDTLAVWPDGIYGWAVTPEPIAWWEPGPQERHWIPLTDLDDPPALRVARGLLAHATQNAATVNALTEVLAGELQPTGEMHAESMRWWLDEHDTAFNPTRHGVLEPFVRLCPIAPPHALERYVITLDGWDLILIDVGLWEDDSQARVAVTDLDGDAEFCFDALIFVTETGLPDHLPPNEGHRVHTVEDPPGRYKILIDTHWVAVIDRDDTDATRARVAVIDHYEMYDHARFDRTVRYRQLPTAHPTSPSHRLRRFSETTSNVAPLDDGRYY